ncbi:MAG: hypothetical protein K0Q58_337 [Microbacterium sp.]|jgi:WXG100 family type VII secretion target|nr:hypothetical protein [Microbacterium sp.]
MISLKKTAASAALLRVLDGIDEIEAQLAALRDETSRLETRWDGEAREAMSSAVREWDASLERLRQIGREASRLAGGSVDRVHDFDRRRASAWHR